MRTAVSALVFCAAGLVYGGAYAAAAAWLGATDPYVVPLLLLGGALAGVVGGAGAARPVASATGPWNAAARGALVVPVIAAVVLIGLVADDALTQASLDGFDPASLAAVPVAALYVAAWAAPALVPAAAAGWATWRLARTDPAG